MSRKWGGQRVSVKSIGVDEIANGIRAKVAVSGIRDLGRGLPTCNYARLMNNKSGKIMQLS